MVVRVVAAPWGSGGCSRTVAGLERSFHIYMSQWPLVLDWSLGKDVLLEQLRLMDGCLVPGVSDLGESPESCVTLSEQALTVTQLRSIHKRISASILIRDIGL